MKTIFLVLFFTQNNVFLTLTTYKGEIIFWNSIGSLKIKGLKKLSGSLIKNFIFSNLQFFNNQKIQFYVKIKGSNKIKKIFLRSLSLYLTSSVISFEDFLNNANNGCKLRKKRRL